MDSRDGDFGLQWVQKRLPPMEDAPFWLGPLVLAGVLVVIFIGVSIMG